MFTRLHGLQTVCLRYFNVFGPRQSIESEYAVVVPTFIAFLLTNQPPPIFGTGHQSRDFTILSRLGSTKVPSPANSMVVSATNAVNHPTKRTKPFVGVVN